MRSRYNGSCWADNHPYGVDARGVRGPHRPDGTPVAMRGDTMTPNITATVTLLDDGLDVAIHDELPGSSTAFATLDARAQSELASEAWRLGLRVMANAHAQAEEAKLSDVGRTLIADVEHHLAEHLRAQERSLATALKQYFDPDDGKVAERMAALVGDRGTMPALLEKFVGPRNSVLAETLARAVGEGSVLFQKLSPSDSEGIVKVLESKIADALARNQRDLKDALDPLAPDGAVARFLRQLRDELATSEQGKDGRIAAALAALDANDEASAISRLMRETDRARDTLVSALNPSVPGSPLATVVASLRAEFDRQSLGMNQFQEAQRLRQEELDKSIQATLARFETKRREDARAPQGGHDFEAALSTFVTERLQNAPVTVDATGGTVGQRARCKVGDLVVRHTAEGAFAGSALVIEAKHDSSYTVSKALAELDEARDNRGASAGLMVMATSHASRGFPRFARHGQNVLVCWDPDDSRSDAWLEAGLLLGLYLVSRAVVDDRGDIEALADVEGRIGTELDRVAKLEKLNDKIRDGSEGIEAELRKAKKQLTALLDKAKATLRALNVTLVDESLERAAPLSLARLSDSSDRLQ